jgi:hypothetical protein
MSNDEVDCVCWLMDSLPTVKGVDARPLHIRKPLLAHSHAQLLLDVSAALARGKNESPVDADFCRRYLSATAPEVLAPATLIDGRDVMSLGIPAGPVVREILSIVRNEQLDELIIDRQQALARLQQLSHQLGSSL